MCRRETEKINFVELYHASLHEAVWRAVKVHCTIRNINPGTADDEMSLYSAVVVVVVVVVVGGIQGRMIHGLTATRQDLQMDAICFPRNVYLLHVNRT